MKETHQFKIVFIDMIIIGLLQKRTPPQHSSVPIMEIYCLDVLSLFLFSFSIIM